MAIEASDDKEGALPGPLVAFDFDGTLTFRDSLRDFIAWRAGSLRHALGMLRLAPATLRYGLDHDKDALKAAMVGEFLRGLTRAELAEAARRYAEARGASLLRPDALAAWNSWRQRGATLIIVTASPETTVAPFARQLGADRLIGSRLTFDAQDRVAGGFDGPNCRGAEKVARIRQAFGADVRLKAAYGDSAGDREMLALADQPFYRLLGTPP